MANEFLKKQSEMKYSYFTAGMNTGYQKCWDLISLAIGDADVLHELHQKLDALEHEYGDAWLNDVESDVKQRDIDEGLKQIYGGCVDFFVRYPNLKKPDYNHGNKKWRG